VSNLNTLPGALVAYLPDQKDLQTVGNFLVAALNNTKPAPITLSQEVDGQRTLSMSVSGPTVTVTMFEANISTTLSVAFSTMYHYFILAELATSALSWSGGEAPELKPPTA